MAREVDMPRHDRGGDVRTLCDDCENCEVFRKECANCPLLYPRAQCFAVGCPVVEWCERVGCPVLKENLEIDKYWGWDA